MSSRDRCEKRRAQLPAFVPKRNTPWAETVSERTLRPKSVFRIVTRSVPSERGANLHGGLRSVISTGQINGRTPLAAP